MENKGLIERTPGQARSLHLLIPPEQVPGLETGQPPSAQERSLLPAFPNVEGWINEHEGHIEIGYDPNTDTFTRALDEGGMVWGGGHSPMTLEEALQALDAGLAGWKGKWA